MKSSLHLNCVATLLTVGTLSIAQPSNVAAQEFKHENSANNLKALCQEIQKAVAAKDTKKAAALNRSVMPNEARIKKGLRDNVAAADLTEIVNFHIKMNPANDAAAAELFAVKPEHTDVKVHAATTEEIAQYTKGSVAFNEFPGGAQKLAEKVLRPGMTYYEVEFVSPGASAGIKFHLFYWDGSQWSMLGPIWRNVK